MAEDILPFFDREIKDQMQGIIKVVGVGGGGCNAVRNMYLDMMDEYAASYYIISGHARRYIAGSDRVWYNRLKVITLPRHLVQFEDGGK